MKKSSLGDRELSITAGVMHDRTLSKSPSISRYLRGSFSRNALVYGASLLTSAASAANNIVGSYFLARGFVSLESETDREQFFPYLLAFIGSWLAGNGLSLINDELLTPISTRFSHMLTSDTVRSYFRLPMEQTNCSAGSEAVHYFGISYEQIGRSYIYGLFGKITPAVIELIAATVFVAYAFGPIGFVIGAAIFIHLGCIIIGRKSVAKAQNGYVLGLFKAYEFIISQVDQYENTHYFGGVNRELNCLSGILRTLDIKLNKSILVRNRAIFLESYAIVAPALLIGSTLYYVHDKSGRLNRHDFLWYIFYVLKISPSFEKLSDAANKLYGDYETFLGLIKYLQAAYDNTPLSRPELRIGQPNATITFDRLNFSYSDGQAVLNDFSLNINAGETVVITGSSGAGKSSIFKLLQGFYNQQAGLISVAGQDIAQVDIDSLRIAMAIVPQSPVLQNTSIYENIKYANPKASDAEIQDAARLAGLEKLISDKGFDFVVGSNGAKLSGGQRQRVAIARAYLRRKAPILLLDEPTSALDPKTEKEILVELDKLLREEKRTTLIISHRLATVNFLKEVDCIVYLENGKIAEQGTYSELMVRNGLFAAQMKIAQEEEVLYRKQALTTGWLEESEDIAHGSDDEVDCVSRSGIEVGIFRQTYGKTGDSGNDRDDGEHPSLGANRSTTIN